MKSYREEIKVFLTPYLNGAITGQQIAEIVGCSPATVSGELGKLLEIGTYKPNLIKYNNSKKKVKHIFEKPIEKDFTIGDWDTMTDEQKNKYYE